MRWKSRSRPAFHPFVPSNLDEEIRGQEITRRRRNLSLGSRLKGESLLGISINEEFTLRVVPPPVRCMRVPLPDPSLFFFEERPPTENITGRLVGAIRGAASGNRAPP